MAKQDSLLTKCPSKYSAGGSAVALSTVGTVALYVVFALAVYATMRAVVAGRRRDRRTCAAPRTRWCAALAAALVAIVALEYGHRHA